MTTRPRRRDGPATRERLLQAALELYATNGFEGTTTPALAARAGIAEGTIYRHFTSKQHLLNEVYRQAQRWGLDLLREFEGDRVRRAPERLTLFARHLVERAAQEAALTRMFLSTSHDPLLDDASQALHREFLDTLVQLIATGKAAGQVRPGPAELWASIWLLIVGYVAERVAEGSWTADGTQVAMTLDAAWDAIAMRGTG